MLLSKTLCDTKELQSLVSCAGAIVSTDWQRVGYCQYFLQVCWYRSCIINKDTPSLLT